MSAWERARHIPWNKIPSVEQVSGSTLESEKERIFRQLQRETIEDEMYGQERDSSLRLKTPTSTSTTSDGEAGTNNGTDIVASQEHAAVIQAKPFPFSSMELLRRAAFGMTIGSITGAVFGFMDGMRTVAAENTVLTKASQSAKVRYVLQGTSRSAFVFGGFFGGFQSVKYGIRVAFNDPSEVVEIVGAAALSMGALYSRPAYRAAAPYAFMLVAMDCAQLFMRTNY
jgi:hypothetical protein